MTGSKALTPKVQQSLPGACNAQPVHILDERGFITIHHFDPPGSLSRSVRQDDARPGLHNGLFQFKQAHFFTTVYKQRHYQAVDELLDFR
jgi:hypothetical protein